MKALQLLFSKNYWLYIFSINKTINALLGTLGIIWLLVESTSYFSISLSNKYKSDWPWLLIIGAVWIMRENWPRSEFCFKLKNLDILIQISIGNVFKYEGDLILSTNTSFDTSFINDIISKNSIQGQLTTKYFKEPRYLDQDIKAALRGVPSIQLPNKLKGNKSKYELGTVVKLKLVDGKYAYLIANSHMNNQSVTSTTFDNILLSLGMLWDFILTKGELNDLNIAVVGTGRGRLLQSRETIIKAIVESFIAATASGQKFTDKLNIVIYPKDFVKHKINIQELCDYLKLKCHHY